MKHKKMSIDFLNDVDYCFMLITSSFHLLGSVRDDKICEDELHLFDDDYLDDPLGIAVPWEEKYGKNKDNEKKDDNKVKKTKKSNNTVVKKKTISKKTTKNKK